MEHVIFNTFMHLPQKFLNEMGKMQDVWFVTNWQAIQWMREPTPISHLNSFEPWYCKHKVRTCWLQLINHAVASKLLSFKTGAFLFFQFERHEIACNIPKTCKLMSRILQGERYLSTCNECPQQYPWIRNEFGLDSRWFSAKSHSTLNLRELFYLSNLCVWSINQW